MLGSVYELREAILRVRNPFMQYSKEPDLPEDKLKELSQREREWHTHWLTHINDVGNLCRKQRPSSMPTSWKRKWFGGRGFGLRQLR